MIAGLTEPLPESWICLSQFSVRPGCGETLACVQLSPPFWLTCICMPRPIR